MIKMLNTIAAIVPDMRQLIRILSGGIAVALLGMGLSSISAFASKGRSSSASSTPDSR